MRKNKSYFSLKKVNRIIRLLIVSDLFVVGGFALVAPIFAIYITRTIEGADLAVLGIAEAIYLLTRSVFQVPFAMVVDRIKGENDNFWAVVIGLSIYAIVPLLYLSISFSWQLYAIQFLYGLGSAIAVPSWMAIFIKNVDKNHEGLEWGVYEMSVGLGSALAAFMGGVLSEILGFAPVFLMISFMSLAGIAMIFMIRKDIYSGKSKIGG
ncbi:MAG: MFS transporter [Candidatus Moranbacteria bacterium]|jgi:DHA1 family quinolone resistance protein-like MFS transporter|nr:MFS transporter [Candidatus Moranbacteria bacterium]MDX9855412.1 MFS transporter [Candidatus Moranbacteria bacterium]